MKNTYTYIIILLAIVGAYLVSIGAFTGLTPSSVVSVSQINYGSVSNGKLLGAKYVVSASLSPLDDTVLITTKDMGLIFGQYKIMPKKNIKIVMSSTNPRAVSSLVNYQSNYYKTLSINSLQGNYWNYYTPYSVKVYADESSNPTTLISSQTINQISNSQVVDIGSGIKVTQTSINFIGPAGLPDSSNILVLTPSLYPDITSKFGYDNTVKVVTKSSVDSKISYFKSAYPTLNDPLLSLWTGYDKYDFWGSSKCSGILSPWPETQGYCKIPNWNGLKTESQSPSYQLPIYYSSNQLLINNIQYGSNINLEIPSEIVDSLAILIGVGKPVIVSSYLPSNMIQGTPYTASVTVKNDGDTDGFTITPNPRLNKLIVSPVTIQEQLAAGATKTYSFSVTIGASSSTSSYTEPVVWEVSAQHDGMVTKTDTYSGTYNTNPTPSVTPTGTPSTGDGSVTTKAWYENLWLMIGLAIIMFSAVMYLSYGGKK